MDKPLTTTETVKAEWIDYNGHMNVAYYVLVFDHATDALLEALGMGPDWRDLNKASAFVAEAHVTYDSEVGLGDVLAVETRIAGWDSRRIQVLHVMSCAGRRVATNEVMLLFMDMTARRVAALPQAILSAIRAHAEAAVPDRALLGRAVRQLPPSDAGQVT
ncbi:MAG: thioesterase family protein [Rhodospirillales bacterium]